MEILTQFLCHPPEASANNMKEPITINGLNNLKSELENLKNVQRPKVVEAIAEARSHGDLKENAEYHAAKEQQALIESRVIAINDLVARANVIDVTKLKQWKSNFWINSEST